MKEQVWRNLLKFHSVREAPNELRLHNTILNHRKLNILKTLDYEARRLRISSYNILSRHYVWESVYSYLPLVFTNWRHRLDRLDHQFRDLCSISDIMCFQEMEYQVYKSHWEGKFITHGFDSLFARKPMPGYWTKGANMMDGVSIFYNRDKFELLNYQRINLSDHFKSDHLFEQTKDTQERLNIRNTVALIAVLKHKVTNETIFLSNIHLYWSPKHDDVKFMQTYLMTKLLQQTILRHYKATADDHLSGLLMKHKPKIVMVGDFNSEPNSMVYEFLSTGKLDTGKEKRWVHDYGEGFTKGNIILNPLGCFKSPYKELFDKKLFTKTTYTPKFKGIIDYMWFNDGSMDCRLDETSGIKFTKVLGDVDQEYLDEWEGFPNGEFPSDHIPIYVELEL